MTGTFTRRPVYTCGGIPLSSSQNKKCFGQMLKETQNIHFMFNNFFSENRAVMR
jgi:hypothetical protein